MKYYIILYSFILSGCAGDYIVWGHRPQEDDRYFIDRAQTRLEHFKETDPERYERLENSVSDDVIIVEIYQPKQKRKKK